MENKYVVLILIGIIVLSFTAGYLISNFTIAKDYEFAKDLASNERERCEELRDHCFMECDSDLNCLRSCLSPP